MLEKKEILLDSGRKIDCRMDFLWWTPQKKSWTAIENKILYARKSGEIRINIEDRSHDVVRTVIIKKFISGANLALGQETNIQKFALACEPSKKNYEFLIPILV